MEPLPETFKMCDVPEALLTPKCSSTIDDLLLYMEKLNHDKPIDLSKRCEPKVFDEISEEKALQKTLKYKNKRWDKKRKHTKDKKDTVKPVKQRRTKGCCCDVCMKAWSWGHKHKRAEKVYTQEEYFDCVHQLVYGNSRDAGDYLDYMCSFDSSGYDEYLNKWWLVDEWFCNEIGYGYLISNEWKDLDLYTLPLKWCNLVIKPVDSQHSA